MGGDLEGDGQQERELHQEPLQQQGFREEEGGVGEERSSDTTAAATGSFPGIVKREGGWAWVVWREEKEGLEVGGGGT